MTFQGKKHTKKTKKKISKSLVGNIRGFKKNHTPWNKANGRQNRMNNKKAYKKRRKFIDTLKNVSCIDCNNNFPPECMDFDHVRGKKKFGISQHSMKNMKDLLKEIEKCDIVCANCHRIRTKKSDLLRKRKAG